jgi:hypothetical protein
MQMIIYIKRKRNWRSAKPAKGWKNTKNKGFAHQIAQSKKKTKLKKKKKSVLRLKALLQKWTKRRGEESDSVINQIVFFLYYQRNLHHIFTQIYGANNYHLRNAAQSRTTHATLSIQIDFSDQPRAVENEWHWFMKMLMSIILDFYEATVGWKFLHTIPFPDE